MGVFGKSKKELAGESIVYEALSHNKLLDALTMRIVNNNVFEPDDEEMPWLTKTVHYYDDGRRMVVLGKDSVAVLLSTTDEEWLDRLELNAEKMLTVHGRKVIDRMLYHFTDAGYVPLHERLGTGEESLIGWRRVMEIFMGIVKDRLQKAMPGITFSEIKEEEGEGAYYFYYFLPPVQLKDWFN